MIVTVTLNPALDKTANVDTILPGQINRLRDVCLQTGGKGINVSRMILALGGMSTAVGFAGGASGDLLLRMMHEQAISTDFVITNAITRENIKITDHAGITTEFNEPGQPVTVHEIEFLTAKMLYRGRRGSYFVLAGSLPEDSPSTVYRDIIEKLKNTKSTILLDTAGDALSDSINAGVDVLKVNRQEFCVFLGLPENAGEPLLYEGAMGLCARGLSLVVVTLGRDGAMFVTREQSYRAYVPAVPVKSTTGAGDCVMGGIALGLEKEMPLLEMARLATAASVCSVMLPGTAMPNQNQVGEMMKQIRMDKLRAGSPSKK